MTRDSYKDQRLAKSMGRIKGRAMLLVIFGVGASFDPLPVLFWETHV